MKSLMREFRFPLSKPKQRLFDAAERLFAQNGFEAVSVRDITGAAEANVAAVNYHFGSREDLVELVVAHRMGSIVKEQLARIETLEKKSTGNKTPPIEELLEAMFRPFVKNGGIDHQEDGFVARLLGRILSRQGAIYSPQLEAEVSDLYKRFKRLLAKSLPSIASEELDFRIHFIHGATIQLLMGHPGDGSDATSSGATAFGRLIRFAAAGLREGSPAEAGEKSGPQATFNF